MTADLTDRPASPLPAIRAATRDDLTAALRAGLRDFAAAPRFGLFFAGVFVAGGWLLVWALAVAGQLWWTIPLSLGFPLLGPFVAAGLYEVSRRLEAGQPLDWPGVLRVVVAQKDRQIAFAAALIVVFFLFWNFLGHMIFALFLGLKPMTNISSSFDVLLAPAGLAMLAFGGAVGAGFALVLFATQVISLPMMLDREVDFVTAMIASLGAVAESPQVMLGWGALIAVALFAGMLPGFLGLFVVLPVAGHASWHLYRRLAGPTA